MASAAHNPTLSPDGQLTSSARAAVDIIAVTNHDDFLLELGEALGGQASVAPVDSTAEALKQLGQSKRLQILMIDSRGLQDIRADVDKVQAQVPAVQILVFAEIHAQTDVAASLKGSKVFAVLPLPVDSRKTMAVFGGAVAELKASRAAPAPATPAAVISTTAPEIEYTPIRPEPRNTEDRESSFPLKWVGVGAALAILAAGAMWLITRDKVPPSPPPVAKTATAPLVETPLVKGKVDELLEKARGAMRERRYTEPAGDNALLYYRSAAAADPGNGEAIDGLTRIGTVLAARFEEVAADSKHYDEAATILAQFKNALPEDARVAEFQVRLGKWRAQLTREQEEARQKRLVEEKAQREAAAAEAKKARDERAAAAAAAETERQAQLARDKARFEEQKKVEQAAKAVRSPISATPDSSAARRSGSALQSKLKRKRYVAPEYPQVALQKRTGGVVTLSFTVDTKGEPRGIQVESAEPAGMFDRAATDAVKRWRYEPLVVDGVATEVPARMAIRFAPPD